MFNRAFPLSALTMLGLLAGQVASAQQDEQSAADPADEPAQEAAEQDEFLDRTPENCIQVTRIRDTEVIDDRTIVFYMRGRREVYRNFLRDNCPNLARSDRFMYQTRTGRLCESDLITVLDDFAGRLDPRFTCRLGAFHPITREEAELMELEPDQAAAVGRSVEITPVELPEDEAVPADAASDAAESDPAEAEVGEPVEADDAEN